MKRTLPTTKQRQNRRRRSSSAIKLTLSTLAATNAQETCPPSFNGWAATADCKQYFWCSAGSPSSILYNCIDSMEFNVATSICQHSGSFECQGTASPVSDAPTTASPLTNAPTTASALTDAPSTAPEIATEASPGEQSEVMVSVIVPDETAIPMLESTTAPTNFPSKLGPPLYFGDHRTSSCRSAAADPTLIAAGFDIPPGLTEDQMYRSKEECCSDFFPWAPLEQCLGEGWVETNYIKATRSPTKSPSTMPSGMPSSMPSVSYAPSAAPIVVASEVPSSLPSSSPSRITMVPTTSSQDNAHIQTFSSNMSQLSDSHNPTSYLVELLGWANTDYSEIDNQSLTTKSPTQRPVTDSFAISEVILPVMEDATVSLLRKGFNFGSNFALAVDGGTDIRSAHQGDDQNERFDTLLKFDVGMIDYSKPLDTAVLRVYALKDCASGGTFVTTTDSSWSQETVTWDTSPLDDGYEIGSIGAVSANTWYEIDMLPALSWNDSGKSVISIRISSSMSSRCMYSSMESGQSKAPYLNVRYGVSDDIQEFSSVLNEAPVAGQFLLLRTTDDATLDASNDVANLGTDSTLKVSFDLSSRRITDVLVRFDLSEIAGSLPVSAVLSLYAETDCESAGSITTTEDISWSDSDVTWSSAPSYKSDTSGGGFNLGTFGPVTSHKWYGFDVVQAVKQAVQERKDAVTFRISASTVGGCLYSSRESGRDPKLMVAF